MDLSNKKILVTGGAGFIGSHTIDALITEGADVVVVDNLSTGGRRNLNPRARFYEMNIGNPSFEDILSKERPNIIYHFALFATAPKSAEDPLLNMDCLIGSLRILRKVKELGIKSKIIFASSGFVYGDTPNLPAKETEPVDPIAPYVISKNTIENYLKFYRKNFGIPYVVLRYSTVYGPKQVTGAMADYIRKLSQNQQAEMWGDGTKTRDCVYIEDVVRANLLAPKVPDNHPDPVFNVATAKETTLNEIYKKIADLLGKEAKQIYLPDRPGEQIRYCLDYSKIKKELGWEPKVSLEEGLKRVVGFWLQNNLI